jgi:hypothetical protein
MGVPIRGVVFEQVADVVSGISGIKGRFASIPYFAYCSYILVDIA